MSFTDDKAGNLVAHTDPLGNTTAYAFDALVKKKGQERMALSTAFYGIFESAASIAW